MHYSELKLYLSGAYDSTFFLSAGPNKNKYIFVLCLEIHMHMHI